MIKFFKTTLFLLFIVYGTSLFAQVTIGNSEIPAKGALLQLKNMDGVTDGGVNANKGLGLPRVELKKYNSLDPLVEDADIKPTSKSESIGMIVYNTNYCLNIEGNTAGIYVWTEEAWEPLFSNTQRSAKITDPRDGEEYTIANFGAAGTWMTQNLRYIGANMTLQTQQTNNNLDIRYYMIPGKQSDWLKEFGLLYNWRAVIDSDLALETYQGEREGERNELVIGRKGICPEGWHVPSDVEINILEKELLEQNTSYSSSGSSFSQSWEQAWNTVDKDWRGINKTEADTDGHGKVLLALCTPSTKGNKLDYTHGKSNSIDSNGFYGIPTGWGGNGITNKFGERVYFWSSSGGGREASTNYFLAACRFIDNGNKPHLVFRGSARSHELLPIRCKKD